MSESIIYIYGIVGADTALAGAPAGLEEAPVELVREGELAALVSRLPAAAYGRERVEALVGDVAWLGGRAVAHDGVITWASARGGIVPTPMFTLYSDTGAVQEMLRAQREELARTLAHVAQGEEYGVRLFRVQELLERQLPALSPQLAKLEAQARDASPGQRYLLERKLEAERLSEMRRVSRDVAREVYDALAPQAMGAVREPLPRAEGEAEAGMAVLNAYFLVRRGTLEPFRRSLTELASRYGPRGFRVEFTGPWPPYHFVRPAS
ncbi:MAG TPA: GvpL/GvpF family gas vesicle protein [Gemmatimonadaceae bacterium]|nr:GvpL/GvpF family gas vesicle protein [Gemmatimonadaceae bacterium]